MVTHHSADARTALMVAYIARYANPRGGGPLTRATVYPPQRRELDAEEGSMVSRDALGAQGRTIYNADTHPINQGDREDKDGVLGELERIDEEERRRKHWDQFLMAARGDFEEEGNASSSSSTVSGEESAMAEEMFALYVRDV